MAPQIKKLSGVSLNVLSECLHLAFADYVVPLYVSSSSLARKIKRENIELDWSVGLFDGRRLVGFILHGLGEREGEKVLYNGGTGILPDYRGSAYTRRMYEFLLPRIRQEHVEAVWLEVIEQNERALKVYQQLGFERIRELDCFLGEAHGNRKNPQWPHLQIEELDEPIWEALPTFFDYPPSWQNDLPALRNDLPGSKVITVRQGQQYLGYLIYSVYNRRLTCLAVHPLYRRLGIGKALLRQLPDGQWSVINIDRRNAGLISFLKNMSWKRTFSQLEMKWSVVAPQ